MKSSFAQLAIRFLSALLGRLLWLWAGSLRWYKEGGLVKKDFWDLPKPGIFVFWHNQQLMMPALYRITGGPAGKLSALISQHRDGRLIAGAVKFFGIDSVAGSSTRGFVRGTRELQRVLAQGSSVGITPDGPRGPRHKFKKGALLLAMQSGCPIYPVALGFAKYWTFGSWDKMMLPKPFSRVVGIVGEPLFFPPQSDAATLDQYAAMVEAHLNQLTLMAENYEYR